MVAGTKLNGWTVERDERGFWLAAETQRHGPFARPALARMFARDTPAPKPRPKTQPKDTE